MARKVRMIDLKGESLVGEVEVQTSTSLELFCLDEALFVEFEKGVDGNWYEINDSQTPWKLEEVS